MSMYKALYRTYRPERFAQIVGQQHIVTTLKNTIVQQKIGHAYLFHGPRGTGKTSIAKIFAAAVNCTAEGDGDKPCHKCKNCELIDNGQATDILELDAASNNGVDEIRQIREFARYAPTHFPYKIYIIDEVHMLSTAAFNALLKTLEEPPTHVIFILATTEIHKIPATIISRCQRFDFKKINTSEMIAGIKPILKAENIKMSVDALVYLAEYADGSMRDALSILDQMRTYTTKKIELQDLHEVIGSVGYEIYVKLMHALLAKDTQIILRLLEEVLVSGKNVQLFVEGFLQYLLHEIANSFQGKQTFNAETLFFMLEQMNQLAAQMRTAFLPHVALQAVFLELAYEHAQQKTVKATNVLSAQTMKDVPTKTMDAVQAKPTPMQSKGGSQGVMKDNMLTSTTDVSLLDASKASVASKAKGAVKIVEKHVIKDEALARASLGRAMNAAVAKLKTGEKSIINKSTIAEAEKPSETPTTVVNEMSQKQKNATPPSAQSLKNGSEDEQQLKKYEEINQEKHRLLLRRVMAEVMLHPEYNQLEKIKQKWHMIKFEPGNQSVIMLLDTEPKIATEKEIVLLSANKALTSQLQRRVNKTAAESFISELFGETYEIIIVDEEQWLRERKQFSQDWKANKVSPGTIDTLVHELMSLEGQIEAQGLEFDFSDGQDVGEKGLLTIKEEKEPIVEEAINIFGSDIVEVK